MGASRPLTCSFLSQAMEGVENPRSQVSPTLSSIYLPVYSSQFPDLSLLPLALSPQDSGSGTGQEPGPSQEQEPSQVRPSSSEAWGSQREVAAMGTDPSSEGTEGAR